MEKYLNKSIKLLQEQTLKDIEIIAVNDFSIDKRIKIINNTKNYGLLYARAMGIIHSKGEYLMNLDPDDEYENIHTLQYLYNKAVITKVDILSYSFFWKSKMKIKNLCNKFDKIMKQPEIFEEFYKSKDVLIWNKMIKREIFIKAYKLYENYIYYKKWNYHEDNIWSLLVHKLASTKLCLNKLIYIYNNNINDKSIMNNRNSLIEFINFIYRFEMERKILNNSVYFKYIRNECHYMIYSINKSLSFKNFIRNNTELKNIAYKNLKICIKHYNISKQHKIIISQLNSSNN